VVFCILIIDRHYFCLLFSPCESSHDSVGSIGSFTYPKKMDSAVTLLLLDVALAQVLIVDEYDADHLCAHAASPINLIYYSLNLPYERATAPALPRSPRAEKKALVAQHAFSPRHSFVAKDIVLDLRLSRLPFSPDTTMRSWKHATLVLGRPTSELSP